MAPQRLRPSEDSRPDSSTATLKPIANPGNGTAVLKGKRANTAVVSASSNLRDVTSVAESSSTTGDGAFGGINWATMPTHTLHAYRYAHRLDTPSAYSELHTQLALTSPQGLGRFSPSMARPANKRRVSKETLALAVRKDFNAAAVNETDVVTSFLYSVRNQNKHFRARFTPIKGK